MQLKLEGSPAEIALFLKNLNEKIVTLHPRGSLPPDIKPEILPLTSKEIERLPHLLQHLPDVNPGSGEG